MSDQKKQGHYIHNVTYTYRERLVGVFVLAAALAFLTLMAINISATHVFEDKVVYHAYLNDGKGVDSDTPVKISGIEAGRVSSLEITDSNKVHVEMFVYERFHERIRSNATATLNRLSMLGVSAIDISPGTVDSPVLEGGATIDIRETLSVDQMMEAFAELLHQTEAGSHTTIVTNLATVAENLKLITGRIRDGKGAAGMLLYDEDFDNRVASTLDSLDELLASASERLAQMEPLLNESDELVSSLHSATTELPAVVSEVRDSAVEAKKVLTLLSREMESLPDFMVRADLLLKDADELIETLERIWPVSSALQRPRDNALIEPQVAND
jgi:phospholipid/cholesterol/gamma-HCH transport system substrate-binding protein